jgi:hypothetical protein
MRLSDQLPHLGRLAAVSALAEAGVSASIEFRRRAGAGFELLLWLDPPRAKPYVDAVEFWSDWTLGEAACWVRFRYETSVFNRAAFAAVEVRPAHDPALRPQGAWLLPLVPPCPPSRATS